MSDEGDLFGGYREPFVTEPGRYDMPDEVYHADPVVGGSLSSTGARAILRSPAKFIHARQNGSEPRRVFDVGSAAHMLVLGQGAPIEVVEGTSAKGVNAWINDADKLRVRQAREAGKTPLCPRDNAQVLAMADALRANSEVAELLSEGTAEEAFFAQDPATKMWLRAKTDYRHSDRRFIDYKTSGKPVDPADFGRTMATFGYHIQGAFYRHILVLLGLIEPSSDFLIIAQEKEAPYLCAVIRPDAEAMAYGHAEAIAAIEVYQRCSFADEWPGYPAEPVEAGLPGWALRDYEERGVVPIYTDRVGQAMGRITDAQTRAELRGLPMVFPDVWEHERVRAYANSRWTDMGKRSGVA